MLKSISKMFMSFVDLILLALRDLHVKILAYNGLLFIPNLPFP